MHQVSEGILYIIEMFVGQTRGACQIGSGGTEAHQRSYSQTGVLPELNQGHAIV